MEQGSRNVSWWTGNIHAVCWRSLSRVIQRFIISFSNNHKMAPVQHGIQNSLKSTGPGRRRIWAAQNLNCHSWAESWSLPCQGWTDLMGTARGTSHPSRPWSSQPKVPARIVPRAGPTAEVIKVKPAASQLFISVLLQTREEKLEPGTKLLSQPTICEVPSHSRAVPFLLHLSIHSNVWALPKFSVLHSGTIFHCKTSHHTKQWATLEVKAFT